MIMEWSTVTALFGGIIMVLTFVWGIIKVFKKPATPDFQPDLIKEWEVPLSEFKKKLEQKWEDIANKMADMKTKLNQLENAESYDKKDLEDLKTELAKLEEKFEKKIEILTGKQDKMLERFIEFLQQQ